MTCIEPIITWEEEIFPTVHLPGGLEWHAHHGAGPDSDQIDGKLQRRGAKLGEPYRSLDLYAASGPGTEDIRAADPSIVERAAAAWAEGVVLAETIGVTSLVCPGERLDEATIVEMFRRFNP